MSQTTQQTNEVESSKTDNELNEVDEWGQLKQLMENLKIIRKVYYASEEKYDKTLKHFVDNFGKENKEFITILLDYIVENHEFYNN